MFVHSQIQQRVKNSLTHIHTHTQEKKNHYVRWRNEFQIHSWERGRMLDKFHNKKTDLEHGWFSTASVAAVLLYSGTNNKNIIHGWVLDGLRWHRRYNTVKHELRTCAHSSRDVLAVRHWRNNVWRWWSGGSRFNASSERTRQKFLTRRFTRQRSLCDRHPKK